MDVLMKRLNKNFQVESRDDRLDRSDVEAAFRTIIRWVPVEGRVRYH